MMNLIFAICLIIVAVTDIVKRTIPNIILALGAIFWLVFNVLGGDSSASKTGAVEYIILRTISAVIFFLLLMVVELLGKKILGKSILGGGDIKLIAVCVLYLGATGGIIALFISCLIGLLMYVTIYRSKEYFPFGPAISLAAIYMMYFGEPLVRWFEL